MKPTQEDIISYRSWREERAVKPLQTPIALTVAYEFESFEHCIDTYKNKVKSHAYSRISNPTVEDFEQKMCQFCGGLDAVAFSSGMAAISGLYLAVTQSGYNVISSPQIYGGTIALQSYLKDFGIGIRYVDFSKPSDLLKAIDDKTVIIFSEAIANPSMRTYNYEAIYNIAREHQILCVIDNTNTVGLFDCLRWSDVEVISGTKYIGGQGSAVGGVVVCSSFEFSQERYPYLHKSSKDYGGKSVCSINNKGALPIKLRFSILRNFGSCLSPMNSYLFILGLETLKMRMLSISEKTLKLAKWLTKHPAIESVNHPLLNSQNYDVSKFFPEGQGGLFCFTLKGEYKELRAFFSSLKLIRIATNIGDSKTIIQHVVTTSHSQCDSSELLAAGISNNLLRVSVGLESFEDLIDDLSQALNFYGSIY